MSDSELKLNRIPLLRKFLKDQYKIKLILSPRYRGGKINYDKFLMTIPKDDEAVINIVHEIVHIKEDCRRNMAVNEIAAEAIGNYLGSGRYDLNKEIDDAFLWWYEMYPEYVADPDYRKFKLIKSPKYKTVYDTILKLLKENPDIRKVRNILK